ncbi:MAG: PorP/SprF family type IX secretion system membrane protein [Flavobacteriia bacterium]|jgi:type IX secretion system PorP/SprF family membrane protein
MKSRIFIFFISIFAVNSFAQDFHFSQISETPLLINPAATGLFNGWERFQINHRNQWLGANTQFMTSSFAADANFLRNRQQDNAHFGAGFFAYNDIGGDSKFGVQSMSVSLSGILPIYGKEHTISAGIQSGFTSRKADLSVLNYENQWNGTSFDHSIGSGEPGVISSFRHFDASAGLIYQWNGSQVGFQRKQEKIFKIGASVYHANKPQLTYTNYLASNLYRKFVFHASYSNEIVNSYWSYDLSLVQFIQGPHFETIFGGTIKNRMQNGTKSTGYYQDAFFGFGLYARVKDAIIPRIFYDFNGLRIGMSYDITLSQLRKAHKGGSLEFSLSYSTSNTAVFKRGGR